MIYVIYQERTIESIPADLELINSLVEYNFKSLNRIIVFVKNDEPLLFEKRYSENIFIISSCNESWEFSAYDAGYQWIINNYEIIDSDIFIIGNETNTREYNKKYIKYFKNRKIIKWVNDDRVVGFVGENIKPIKILDLHVRRYVATHLFFLNYKILKEIVPFSIMVSDEELFSNDYKEFFKKSMLLDDNFIDMVKARLFGEKNNHNSFGFYHQAKPITLENYDFFKGKVRAIICEYYIGAKIENQNIKLVNLKNMRLFRKVIKKLIRYKLIKKIILLFIRKGYLKTSLRTSKINIE